MKPIPTFLLVTLIAASCATHEPPGFDDAPREPSPSQRAFTWLARQQRPDGYWGTDDHRVTLTSLAILAFLSHGETPQSQDFGRAIQNGLRALMGDATGTVDLPPGDRALLTWCLTETYGMTKIPALLDPTFKQAAALDSATATPWHAFAAYSLFMSGVKPDAGKNALSELKSAYGAQTNGILDQATRLLLASWTGERTQIAPLLERLKNENPTDWRQAESPVQTAFVLSRALLYTGGKDWLTWNRQIYPDILKRQVVRKNLGWWTAESLGISGTLEVNGMDPPEAHIYFTSLMLMTLEIPRFLPLYLPPGEGGGRNSKEEEDVAIEIF